MARKRGNREGTITHRADGRWEARITVDNGKRRCLYGKTRREVAQKLLHATKAREDGLPMPGAHLTVGQYLENWLSAVKTQVRPRTWKRYEQYVRLHAIPGLGRTQLVKLTPEQLEALYAAKVKAGLSPTTVRHLHAVLVAALTRAVRLGRVVRNVAQLASPPRTPTREMRTLDAKQTKRLLKAAAGDRLEALYVLACTTGMREGELLGLRWRYVNLDTGTLQVAGTLQRLPKDSVTANGETFVIAEPKTDRSRRTLKLTEDAVAALRRHRVRQGEERLRLGGARDDWDLVFANELGRPMEAGNLLRRSFWPLLERAKLPRIRFHDLRHGAATLLLEEGVHPAIVAATLGHARASTTIDIYSHVSPGMTAEVATTMDKVLGSGLAALSSKSSSRRRR
jgi:integrase